MHDYLGIEVTVVPLPCRVYALKMDQVSIMSSVAITSSPQTAALPRRDQILVTLAQTTWSVVIALGAVIIGVTTLSFTLAHLGMNTLAFHLSPITHHLSRYCREA